MNIRSATIQDLPQLSQLFNGYRVFYKKPSDVDAAKKFLSDRLENNDSEIYVCEDKTEQLLGFTQLYPLFSSTRMRRVWILNDLFVHPDARGKGVSKLLIEKAKVLVRETGAFGMSLETGKTNHIGNQLYPSTGFKLNDYTNFYEWINEA